MQRDTVQRVLMLRPGWRAPQRLRRGRVLSQEALSTRRAASTGSARTSHSHSRTTTQPASSASSVARLSRSWVLAILVSHRRALGPESPVSGRVPDTRARSRRPRRRPLGGGEAPCLGCSHGEAGGGAETGRPLRAGRAAAAVQAPCLCCGDRKGPCSPRSRPTALPWTQSSTSQAALPTPAQTWF
jgi:hypothetical protein